METYHTNRRVYIIDDLLGAILLIAAAALVLLLDLTRRQICAVYQLAFALCAACSFFVIGGLIDHHLSNDQLSLALYGSYIPSSLTTSYIYLPILASIGVSLALLFSISTCNCDCCCLVGASVSTHQRCFGSRIRANLSLYGCCFIWLYVAIGTRLNVRLRESAINPVGGTLHWMLLRSPFYLAMAHIGSLLFVGLKIFLQHADRPALSHSQVAYASFARTEVKIPTPTLSASSLQTANPTMVEELMRPPVVKTFALAPPRRPSEGKQATTRTPQFTTLRPTAEAKPSPRHATGTKTPRRNSDNNREPLNDGDVSSLISSDSESDDDVLRPSFRSTSSASRALPPRHTSVAVRKRPSGDSASIHSGYSSSPPPSPTRSNLSSGSSSISRQRGTARPGSSSSSSSGRPRLTSSGSSSSTTFLSDTDDHVLFQLEAYGSSGNEASYMSDQRYNGGIRRRAPSIGTNAMRRPSIGGTTLMPGDHKMSFDSAPSAQNEWMECLDEATGSIYFYNTRTGESRWKEH